MNLRQDAEFIIRESIQKVLPDEAVRQALTDKKFDTGGIYVVAGGYCDGETKDVLVREGISIFETLEGNDAYHALERSGGLIITGATGTNVNDVAVLLIKR